MNKICTSLEQSKKLIELGIDVNTADMYYQWYSQTKSALHVGKGSKKLNCDCPAWSLAALLNILAEQDFIIKSLERNNEYQYNIDIPIRHCKIWFSSLLDAAFEMVCWLLENKSYDKDLYLNRTI